MTRVIFWKELREQAAVLIALMALGCGLLAANAVLNPQSSGGTAGIDTGRLAVIMLTMAAGVVVGATLLAGEREQRTFAYLDRLPGTRSAIWLRKLVPGVALTGAATVVFLVAGTAVGVLGGAGQVGFWAAAFTVIAVGSFGWGLAGSARSSTSIGACGLAIGFGMLTFTVSTILGQLLHYVLESALGAYQLNRLVGELLGTTGRSESGPAVTFTVTILGLFVFPYPLSWRLFTAPDRARQYAAPERLPARVEREPTPKRQPAATRIAPVRPARPNSPARRLAWLARRQLVPGVFILSGLALVMGLVNLIPEIVVPVAVVGVGTFLGLLTAINVWQDEQTSEANRFWGERRIPARRVWLTKTVFGLAVAVAAGVVSLIPFVVQLVVWDYARGPGALRVPVNSGLLNPDFPFLTTIFLGPVTGFAFGQVAAMLFRKAIVAGAVSVMVAGSFVAVWLPSIFTGGLTPWVLFVPAGVALGTSRLLVWAWASEALGSPRAVVRLMAGLTTAVAAVLAGLAHRAFEVDPGPAPLADREFAAALPSFDVEQAGRVIRSAALLTYDSEGMLAAGVVLDTGRVKPGLKESVELLTRTRGWQQALERVATMPKGVLEDPNEYDFDTPPRYTDAVTRMVVGHLALGLVRQSEGDHADFVKRLGESLAVVRTVRNQTFAETVIRAGAIEAACHRALSHWLAALPPGEVGLLAEVDRVLAAHAADPVDPRDSVLAVQTLARRSVEAPGQWLGRFLDDPYSGYVPQTMRKPPSRRAEVEAELQALMWAFPWERERLRRVVSAGNGPASAAERREAIRGMTAGIVVVPPQGADAGFQAEAAHHVAAARRTLSRLAVAVRGHHAATGSFPAKLADVRGGLPPGMGELESVPHRYGDDADMILWGANSRPRGIPDRASLAGTARVPFRYAVARSEEFLLPQNPFAFSTGFDEAPFTVREARGVVGLVGSVAAFPFDPEWDGLLSPPNPAFVVDGVGEPGEAEPEADEEMTAMAGFAGGVVIAATGAVPEVPEAGGYGGYPGLPGGFGAPPSPPAPLSPLGQYHYGFDTVRLLRPGDVLLQWGPLKVVVARPGPR